MRDFEVSPEHTGEKVYSPEVKALARAMELEDRIGHLEEQLFDNHPGMRVIETSLFIDPAFHRSAVIMDRPDHPERMFGHGAWAGWLEGRVFAREHADEPLTVE